jgi:hypothetical protein
MSSKYVIVEIGGVETPILFSHMVAHSDMKDLFNNIISAGFFETMAKPTEKDDKDICVGVWGKSVTINKKSRLNCDEKLIKQLLRKNY